MKMTTEEKAKAYDGNYKVYTELINRLEDVKEAIKKQNYGIAMDILFKPYPEFQVTTHSKLAESEDEEVRKAFYEYFKNRKDDGDIDETWYGISYDKILSWLEKQGEQKPIISDDALREGIAHFGITQYQIDNWLKKYVDIEKQGEQKHVDNVEPKFKVGDWIVRELDNTCYQIKNCILNVTDNKYGYDLTSGGYISSQDANFYHLWTIQDAKNGDILEFVDHEKVVVGIVSFVNKKTGKVDVSCLLEDNKFKIGNFYALDTINPHPATKEQRDLLFQKMKEVGYEWDSEKKELKKIESDLTEFENVLADVCRGWIGEELGWKDYIIKNSLPLLELAKKQFDEYEQKPKQEWSKEDEAKMKSILFHIEDVENKDVINWFKSFKNRVQPQPKQEWNEEDERLFQIVIDILDRQNHLGNISHTDLIACVRKLKSLRPQNKTYYWTENEIKFAISDYIRGTESYEKMVEKLRCLKPQNT